MPPSDAPIAIGGYAAALRAAPRRPRPRPRRNPRSVTAVRDPFAVAMAALVERIGHRAGAGEMLGGVAPGVAGLPAAMQQQHRPAGRHRRPRPAGCRRRREHARRGLECWSRTGGQEAARLPCGPCPRPPACDRGSGCRAPRAGISAASSCGEPATSSFVPPRPASARDRLRLLGRQGRREPRMQAASAWRSHLSARRRRGTRLPMRVGHVVERGRLERSAMPIGSPTPSIRLDAEAAQNHRADRAGMREREKGGDARAHRVAHTSARARPRWSISAATSSAITPV